MDNTRTKSVKTNKGEGKLIWKIHHWSGFYTGIVIAVLCITGSVAVFIPEIDYIIQRMHYSAASSPAKKWHFDQSVVSLTHQYPDYQSLRIEFPEKPGYAGIVHLTVKANTAEDRFAFFVDMGKDKILGRRNHQNSIANYLRQIHVRLYEGNWGRYFVGFGGVAFVIVTITGLMIYGNFMKRQQYPQIRNGKGLRLVMADWHKLLGISSLAFNLMIALTGAWLGLQGWFKVKNPSQYQAAAVMSGEADAQTTVNWEEVLGTTARYFPDLVPLSAVSSTDGSGTVTISGNIKGLIYERAINRLTLSKFGLQPVFKYDIREKPFWHKFFFVQEALHFGDYGGLGLKITYALLGLVSAFLSISGFVVYFYRTAKKSNRKSAPLKITFIYSVIILLVLVIAALVSTLIGYSTAALMMAVVIDGGLVGIVLYGLIRFLRRKFCLPKPVIG
ncbi:PepSY-associated TM helix domain-containing protein [Parapedobacter koreensis]|uniref:Uncharacterized iron-regulated membrane protein n=1 Tax=Parapedobacter koreensis TaxID=332977 RepID=A0A1H7G3Z9_9SPHI|nr:PepSY-associated TM helix domain-containing protein [Parapedobacter koreensis]SEK30445.1 Uncharacterized iron-regulated membrane protein [Parapedobacter koreensis]